MRFPALMYPEDVIGVCDMQIRYITKILQQQPRIAHLTFLLPEGMNSCLLMLRSARRSDEEQMVPECLRLLGLFRSMNVARTGSIII